MAKDDQNNNEEIPWFTMIILGGEGCLFSFYFTHFVYLPIQKFFPNFHEDGLRVFIFVVGICLFLVLMATSKILRIIVAFIVTPIWGAIAYLLVLRWLNDHTYAILAGILIGATSLYLNLSCNKKNLGLD